jgi:CubicO group peptidase (beta-lactamase class C family)
VTLLLASIAGLGSAAPDSALKSETADVAEVRRQILAVIDDEIALGFSGEVLVVQSDRVVVEGVYGSMKGKSLPPDGRFLIASAAKQFTSAAVLKLQDQGRLDLDDPISKHLAGVPVDKQSITIRQLLLHTSGLPQGYDSESATSWQDAARSILGMTLTATPGEKFQYSNENYQLGVAIVEATSGRNYLEFVRDELLEPAGLHDTGQLDGPTSVRKLSPILEPLPPRLLHFRWGGFGFYTTARDFFAWYRALRSGRLLNPESVAELFAPIVKIGEGHAALGWFAGTAASGKATVFTRGNDDVGSSSVLYAYPENDTVIIVLSHAGQKTDDISWARAVHARIEEILFGAPDK